MRTLNRPSIGCRTTWRGRDLSSLSPVLLMLLLLLLLLSLLHWRRLLLLQQLLKVLLLWLRYLLLWMLLLLLLEASVIVLHCTPCAKRDCNRHPTIAESSRAPCACGAGTTTACGRQWVH